MTGQEWLQYFMEADQQKKRKADWLDMAGTGLGAGIGMLVGGPAGAAAGSQLGGAVGGTAEDAVNKTLSPGSLISNATQGVGGYGGLTKAMGNKQAMDLLKRLTEAGFPLGMAEGGVVPEAPDPYALLEQLLNEQQAAMGAGPQTQPFKMASHPGWEALGTIAGDVLSKLPPPRQTNSSNKTIGAYLPAIGAAAAGVPKYAAGQRAQANVQIEGENKDARESWTQQARDLANRRWALAMKRAGADGSEAVLTPKQYEELGVPPEYRTAAGYKAWLGNRGRADSNVGRLTLAARTNKDISQFPDIRDSYLRIRDSAASGSKTGLSDMALVFSFMRVLDPTSVVREGEYERAVKTAGIPAWVWSAYQRAASGKFLHPDQREDMVRLSKAYYDRKVGAYRNAKSWLDKLAKHYGVDPVLALPNLEQPGTQLAPIDPTVPQAVPGERDPNGYLIPPPGATPEVPR